MGFIKVLVGFVVVGALISCGGDDGESAPEKCETLVDLLCTRILECANDGTTQSECVSSVKTTLPCAQADAVSDGYESCLGELESSPCTVLLSGETLNLPATCKSSILFAE